MPETFTGWPESRVGENLALHAAISAASRRKGLPDSAFAESTDPVSSIRTLTTTVPLAPARLASAGYFGFGKETAFPFTTPPNGSGPGCGGGGIFSLLPAPRAGSELPGTALVFT